MRRDLNGFLGQLDRIVPDLMNDPIYESGRLHGRSAAKELGNRSTNASAESFNARIKLFRANQKGVRNTKFFLFRLTKLYA